MTAAHRRYIAIEALIGATISAVLSVAFVLLIFGARDLVPVTGGGGLIVDAMPQGFAIAFMATLVPILLTRRRLRRGAVLPLPRDTRSPPMRATPRAIATGLLGAGLTVATTAALLLIGIEQLAWPVVLIGKAVWGFVLGGAVAVVATRAALATSALLATEG